MTRFFLDENMNYAVLAPLRELYHLHDFRHAFDEGLSSEDDIPLFDILRQRRFDAIVTKDRQQLSNLDERRALLDSGLHWVGHNAKEHAGLFGITVETSTVTAGLIHVLEDWRSVPHAYHIKGVPSQSEQRLKISRVQVPGGGRTVRLRSVPGTRS